MRQRLTYALRTFQQVLLLALAIYSLAFAILGTVSASYLAGTPSFGVLLVWSGARDCHVVNAITPASWPPLMTGALQIGDCINRVDGIDISERMRVTQHLAERADASGGQTSVQVQGRRGNTELLVRVPAFRLEPTYILQVQLSLFLVGGACWTLALFVYLIGRFTEANQVFAGLFWVLALYLFGQHHGFDDHAGAFFTAFSVMLAMSLIGPLLVHLAFCLPRPPLHGAWLRFIAYIPALLTLSLHLNNSFAIVLLERWGSTIASVAEAISGVLMALGLSLFLGRMAYLSPRRFPEEVRRPARTLLFSWSFAVPLCVAVAYYLAGFGAPFGISLHTVLFLLILPLTGTAFAMLTYQTFSYRGRVLTGLTTLFLSAAIACLVMLIVTLVVPAPKADGVLFVIIWAGALATTLFWYVDNPFRHAFQAFFLRHQQDYRITRSFAAETATQYHLESLLQIAASRLRKHLRVLWVAITVDHIPNRWWIATEDTTDVQLTDLSAVPLSLPTQPAYIQPLQMLGKGYRLGAIWIGPPSTSEPFDGEDHLLFGLLADSLTRSLLSVIQIDYLTRVPELVLEAQEDERQRIGDELHDVIAPLLGGLPLIMERAQNIVERAGVNQQELTQLLKASANRSAAGAVELRTIIGQLQPPSLAGNQFLRAARELVVNLCQTHHISLVWDEEGNWDSLEQQAALQLYRILGQAVTNVTQHAAATEVKVKVTADGEEFVLEIQDNGRGFDYASATQREKHYGLTIMRTRARAVGGICIIDSAPAQGTRVEVRIPVHLESNSHSLDDMLQQLGIRVATQEAPSATDFKVTSKHLGLNWRGVLIAMRLPAIITLAGVCLGALLLALADGKGQAPICNGQVVQICSVVADRPWQRTGIVLNPGDVVVIKVTGGVWTPTAYGDGARPLIDAAGYGDERYSWTRVPEAPIGSLVGRVGYNPPFPIGQGTLLPDHLVGELYLQINDGNCTYCTRDNAGQITANISVRSAD